MTEILRPVKVGSKRVSRRADGSGVRVPRLELAGPALRGLAAGDMLDVRLSRGRIVLTPRRSAPLPDEPV
jgi:hypothetical protein